MEKRLFLLDAYALIYRAYYALYRSPRITTSGMNTSAIFGFCNTLDEVLRKENPSHIAVCFDPKGGHTFRHDAYPEYKAQRDKQPEDITISVPYIKRILDAYRIPTIEVEGYEADDVIGTLSRQAEREGFDVYMMTLDKDYGQLVTDRVFMYRPPLRGDGFEVRGPKEVCEHYGVQRPEQIIDLLALEGDTSDNVPGCPGVGEKTARKLIAEFGSVDNLIANTDRLKGALQKKIAENKEKIEFSKFLVTIKTDVPVGVTVDSLERKAEDVDSLLSIYKELEFKMFINRLNQRLAASAPSPAPTAKETPKPSAGDDLLGSLFDLPAVEPEVKTCETDRYTTATTVREIGETVEKALSKDAVSVAAYAVGEEAMTADWRGLAIAAEPCEAVWIPFPEAKEARAEVFSVLEPLFTGKTTIVGHDLKRLYLLLRRENIRLTAPYYDTSVAHYLIDPEMKHDLATVAFKYLSLELAHAPEARKPYPTAPLETGTARLRYSEEADVVFRLRPVLEEEIRREEMVALMDEIELPLIRVLAEMEWTGVRIDTAELASLHDRLTERLAAMEQEAYDLAGGPFNLGSPAQVGTVLFDRLHIGDGKIKKTAKGQYSTTEQILEKYRLDHPIVDLILKIRRLRKLLATYIDALPLLINPKTGKIHTSYNQTITATGRLSSTNPNLQNIPIRTDDGREIRRAFIPDAGDLIMSADYSQIELRLIADLSADRDMVDAFLSGTDIHTATAGKIYHKPVGEVTDDERRHAKTANFGIIYGISAFGLAERLQISRSEAKALIDGYYATYPHIREYLDESVKKARDLGYVTTIKGRKRRLPDINSRNAVVRAYAERNAVNAPIQGSAADIIKIAMVRVARDLDEGGFSSRMIMQVHDELIFNVVPSELEAVKALVIRDMEEAYRGLVPLEVSCGVAENWLEAH